MPLQPTCFAWHRPEDEPLTDSLSRATLGITEDSLRWMVLDKDALPGEGFAGFDVFREGPLDNDAMAEQGFAGNTAETLRERGRLTGYMKELVSQAAAGSAEPGADIAVATIAHLFDTRDSVLGWMHDVFIKQFHDNVGKTLTEGQKLLAVEELEVGGFHDEAVALKALQEGPSGQFASTVIDFRLGRVLGVAFVVTFEDFERLELATLVAREFERRIVRVVLGDG